MKFFQFFLLIAAIYLAPHVSEWLAVTLGAVMTVAAIVAATVEIRRK